MPTDGKARAARHLARLAARPDAGHVKTSDSAAGPRDALVACACAVALAACQPAERTTPPPAPAPGVVWHVSWEPVAAYEDGTPLDTQPTYVVETSPNETGPWQRLWRGEAHSVELRAPAGRRCFRVTAVARDVPSLPSTVRCAVKRRSEVAAAADDVRR